MLRVKKLLSPLSSLLFFFRTFAAAYEQSGCSAVGSALRSGRRGRAFESPHPDRKIGWHELCQPILSFRGPGTLPVHRSTGRLFSHQAGRGVRG